MRWQPISSSAISEAAYDEPSQTLHIRFQSGRTYSYPNVTPEDYQAFLDAPSPNGYLQSQIAR